MTTITASVGAGGANRNNDVRTVQTLLNKHVGKLGKSMLKVDGNCGPKSVDCIRSFQKIVMKMGVPDGRVDPDGRTLRALDGIGAATPIVSSNLSGATWWHANQASYPNSATISDLAAPFSGSVTRFVEAIRSGGGTVTVSATRRNKVRAYLMHYSWKVSKGLVSPSAVPGEPGCTIIWDHGNDQKSKAAAAEMVQLFGIVYQPSLTSLHISGRAIDMSVAWSGELSITDATGKQHSLGVPRDGGNSALHSIGAGFGVRKLLSDPPHWSDNGH